MQADIVEPGPWERRLAGAVVRRLLYRTRRPARTIPESDRHVPRVRFTAPDGARLVGLHHPAASPRGIVVLAHPDKRLAKHWWTHEGIPAWLNANGYDAFAFDFSVYGESRPGNVYLHTHVLAAVDEARRLAPDLPLHLWGVSIGSYAAANAAPCIDDLNGLVLESPYPTFGAWYAANGWKAFGTVNAAIGKVFPRTYRRIAADHNIAHTKAERILIAASAVDRVTPVALSRTMANAAPAERTTYLEVPDATHLGLFASSPAYRDAVLDTFGREKQVLPDRLLPREVTPLSPPSA